MQSREEKLEMQALMQETLRPLREMLEGIKRTLHVISLELREVEHCVAAIDGDSKIDRVTQNNVNSKLVSIEGCLIKMEKKIEKL